MSQQKPLRIGMYAGSWPQNIGNAFFDFGAEAIMRKAFPSAEIFRTGGAVHWMFNNSRLSNFGRVGSFVRRNFWKENQINGNSIEIGQLAELDLLVFPGMSMCEEFVMNNGPTFQKASENGVAVLGLGAGGANYNLREFEVFSNFFNNLERAAIITRDDDTFYGFESKIKDIYSGIDCAFFLPDYYMPPSLIRAKYEVVTFDGTNSALPISDGNTLRYYAHHDLWGPLPKKYTSKKGTLVSDVPEDYLTLYANCAVTYSDRVHACIASMAYGNSAQLFSDTPRKSLFEKVGASKIRQEPTSLDFGLMNQLKNRQVEITKTVVEELLHND